jgi:hypothetical protein
VTTSGAATAVIPPNNTAAAKNPIANIFALFMGFPPYPFSFELRFFNSFNCACCNIRSFFLRRALSHTGRTPNNSPAMIIIAMYTVFTSPDM